MWWRQFIGRQGAKRREAPEINIWRLQSLFNNFRRILYLNNAVLEDMAHMERALGGEYIFDRAFLESSVRTIASRVHHVTYNLNALTGNGFIPLYDRYQDIRTILDDILSGNVRAMGGLPALPLSAVGWELEPLVGIDLVCLAELRHHPGIRVVDGFVITAEGTQALLGQDPVDPDETVRLSLGDVRAAIGDQLRLLFGTRMAMRLAVTVTRIEGEEELVQNVGTFSLIPRPDGAQVDILTDSAPVLPAQPAAATAASPDPVASYISCLERIIGHVAAASDGPHAVFVRRLLPAPLSGTIRTRDRSAGLFEALAVTATPQGADEPEDIFLLRRTYPFDPITSTIRPRPTGSRFPDGKRATDLGAAPAAFGRGSALVDLNTMKRLAETAITLERMLGAPVRMHWECREDGSYCITGLSPRPLQLEEIPAADLAREQEEAEILCRGGQMVQSGVAAGSVIHVTDDMSPADFPAGAVAVARAASPQLTLVLQKAAAIVTENGTTTGHLATVARELRLPALFGLPDALALLPPGTEVTVNAGEAVVYRGILDLLLRHGAREMDLSPSDPEYRVLRRLLRFIMPLSLVDPESADFSPQGCRSFHDIIHFCHEKAVDELAHFQEHRPGLGAIRTRRMKLGVPMDIRVLDIGGGMAAANGDTPTATDALSEPFSVFLQGLLAPQAWEGGLPSLGLRDILSSMPRSMGILSEPASTLGENLAIVSHDYMNLSLRLGYHFSVIDAHLGSDGSRNYVYFRFAGGLADPERRARRAVFISRVLMFLDFMVSIKGDLVIGRLKSAENSALRRALSILGALTAFSRQQDTGLYSDADTKALFAVFARLFLEPAAPYDTPLSPALGKE